MTEADRFTKVRDYVESYGWRFWKRLRASKSKREYHNYEYMRRIGVPCPGGLEFEDHRNALGLLTYSSISMEKLADTTDIRYLMCLDEYAEIRANRRFRLAVSGQIAHWVRVMHENDFFHLNLNFRNVLVQRDQLEEPRIYFIDVTSCIIRPTAVRRRYLVVKELAFLYKDARKWCTQREQLHFLHVYLQRRKLTAADRRLAAEVRAYANGKWGDRSSTVDD